MPKTEPEQFEFSISGKSIAFIVGALALWAGYSGFSSWQETRKVEANRDIRFQELRTIEEIMRVYGSKMSPEELRNYLKGLGINYETRKNEGKLAESVNGR